uniref:Uncharacterized protein n=1 Tax=Candidatus Nitrotoga fabula TaxID=2182327 RepID=A0A2X0SDZ7_9PROT|nr:protein of unknown function [Candidatus Nitrotoga fabula]
MKKYWVQLFANVVLERVIMFNEKNMALLAPYGSMKFTKLSTKVGASAPTPAPPPGDGKTL